MDLSKMAALFPKPVMAESPVQVRKCKKFELALILIMYFVQEDIPNYFVRPSINLSNM